jgi:hypothetical protein
MRSALPLLLLALLALPGCSDSPTEPDATLRFTGSLTRGARVEHPLSLPHGGNLTLTLEDLNIRLLDVGALHPSLVRVLVGLGRPAESGACDVSTTSVMVEGTVSSFGLRAGEYCLAVFDNGILPEESLIEYTLVAEVTD